MKIGILTYSLFSHGGVQRVTSILCNQWALKHDVELVYLGKSEYDKDKLYNLNENKVKICRKKLSMTFFERVNRKIGKTLNENIGLFDNSLLCNLYEHLIYPKSQKEDLIKFLNEKNFDIIIGSEGEISLLLASIAHRIKAKTIGWQHSSYDAYYYKKKLYSWKKESLSKSIFRRLDKLVVLTENDREKYKNKLNLDCVNIYNPLSFQCNKKSNLNKKNIITVGRLVKSKGFDLLIKAFKKVSETNDEWTLTIVGDGPEKENLLTLVNELKLEKRVKFEGFTNKVEQYYVNSSIFVSSSLWEGFGLVIIEAMECGLPVISFKSVGPTEIIENDKTGFLIENGNEVQLSNQMLYLINNTREIKRMSVEAIRRAEYFNINRINEQWEELFNNL